MHRLAILVLALLFTTSCSLFSSRTDSPSAQERDVPFNARKSSIAEPRKRLLMLPFIDGTGGKNTQVADTARRTLIRQIAESDQVVIIDVADFPKDLEQFKKDGDFDLESVARVASTMGIAGVLEGKVLEIKAHRLGDQVGLFRSVKAQHEAKVRIRLFSAKSSRELLNETRSATVEASTTMVGSRSTRDGQLAEDPNLIRESVTKAFRSVVQPIVLALKKVSWEGKIAMVATDKIYVNAGRMSGIQLGDILKVRESAESVYDPETGELVGVAPGRVKGTLEVVSYFGKDGAVAIVHTGSGFQESDSVELY